jgi:hypothetical protein
VAILPIHSALQNPDIVGNFQQGLKFGTAQRLQRKAEDEERQLRNLAPAIQSGDPAAFGQAAAMNPEYAAAQQSVGDGGIRRLKGAISFIEQAQKTGNPRAVEAAYQQVRPYLARFGQEPPATFAEAEPKFMEAKARIAMLDSPEAQQRNVSVAPGSAIVDPATGQVIYERPFAPQKPIWDSARGVFINPPGAAGPAAGPTKPDMEADIALANEMVAAGVAPEVVDRLLEARGQRAQQMMGAQPAGAQAIPVSGIAPKPDISEAERVRLQLAEQANARAERADERAARAEQRSVSANAVTGRPPTEGERKAATLLQRLRFSQQQLEQAVRENPDAASPGLVQSAVGAVFGESAANAITPAERQRVEAAQLDILDAALTLGTGAAYTREQLEGYRRSYFPQMYDDAETQRDKAARLQNVIQAAEIAAGRAGPQTPAQPAQIAPVQRARNPQTGEVIVLRNGQWVPE